MKGVSHSTALLQIVSIKSHANELGIALYIVTILYIMTSKELEKDT